MKRLITILIACSLGGCAAQTSIQKIGVGYNNAVANLTDQLALLNVVRARNGYPIHYTSLSRLSGSITFKATGAFNAQIKAAAPTDTTTGMTSVAPTGTTLANTITHAVASGGNQYMPSVGAEVDTNPSFDVDVNDTQDFYRGITAAIDPTLLDDLIRQGYDQRELLAATVSNIRFTLQDEDPKLDAQKGESLLFLSNQRGDLDPTPPGRMTPDRDQFAVLFGCYSFSVVDIKGAAKILTPLSRVGGSNAGSPTRLTLQDLALLDGAKLELSTSIGANAADDAKVNIVRPAAKKSVGKLSWNDHQVPAACPLVQATIQTAGGPKTIYRTVAVPPIACSSAMVCSSPLQAIRPHIPRS